MSVAEPHTTFVARDGRVAVLWSHGRLTEHNRPGEPVARVVGRLVDSLEAGAWAAKHGFEPIGLAPPRVLVAPRDDAGGHEMAGSRTVRDATERNEHVGRLVASGVGPMEAIARIAAEYGVSRESVQSTYYRWRRDQPGFVARAPKQRRRRSERRVARPPVTPAPALETPQEEPHAPNGNGVQPSEPDVSPMNRADRAMEQVDQVLVVQWNALENARVALALRRVELEQEIAETSAVVLRIGEHQLSITKAAEALGVTLVPSDES